MSKMYALMEQFHDAILRHDAGVALPLIRAGDSISPEQRLAIYIEGYRTRLVLAIRSDYPTLLALLGEAAFDAFARRYIDAAPPTHFSLDRYPHGFADFFRAVCDDGFACEVAALEAAIAEVFMQEDSEAFSPDELASMTPEAFGAMILKPRRASALLAFSYPVEEYLVGMREGKNPPVPPASASYLYLVRQHNEVKRHLLSKAEHSLLEQLCEGLPVGRALEAAADKDADLLPEIASQLQSWFARWAANGFFQSNRGAGL